MEKIAEKVSSNPMLNAIEKETSITMCGDSKEMRIFSAKATVVKSLLKHDYFEADWIKGEVDGNLKRVEKSQVDDLDEIYAVSGRGPIGLLTVKSSPRSNNYQSSIVNTESIDPDAFS